MITLNSVDEVAWSLYTGFMSTRGLTVTFGGNLINLSQIAVASQLHQTYLSRVFSGNRKPSLEVCSQIAAVLEMTLEDFVAALDKKLGRKPEDSPAGYALTRLGKYPQVGVKSLLQPVHICRVKTLTQ